MRKERLRRALPGMAAVCLFAGTLFNVSWSQTATTPAIPAISGLFGGAVDSRDMGSATNSVKTDAEILAALPVDAYRGCDEDKRASQDGSEGPFADDDAPQPAAADPTPRERIAGRDGAVIKQRVFASLSLDEVDELGPEPESDLCWYRLDGVWREQGETVLDTSVDIDGWASDVPELLSLANGTYTTPRLLLVAPSHDSNRELTLFDGLDTGRKGVFTAAAEPDLTSVLRRGGGRKTYVANDANAIGERLEVDVTRSGLMRLTLDGRAYLRPRPGVTQATIAARSDQQRSDDAFLLSYNLENLSASRRGYDLTMQDPFFLLQNPKSEVFARIDAKSYYIDERRTVPLGLSLVQENSQGMVYRKTLITSEREYQESIAESYGANIGFQGADRKGKNEGDPSQPGASGSAGFEHAKSQVNAMREGQSVAQALGYARSKLYALVVDHPFLSLSDDFVDAIDDARRYGSTDSRIYERIISRFGTHYPYAVTYGAAAKITQSLSEKSYYNMVGRDESTSANAGFQIFGIGGSAHYSSTKSTSSANSGSIGKEGATFVAVGGNGSWDQQGYSAGNTPYPVLLDLRPLHELLNALNFPGEPEIYTGVRRELAQAIESYLGSKSNLLSEDPLPRTPPRPPRRLQHADTETTLPEATVNGFVSVFDAGSTIDPGQIEFVFKTNMDWWSATRIWKANGQSVWLDKYDSQRHLFDPSELAATVKLEFWTAKAFGIHTYIKEVAVTPDPPGIKGRKIAVSWCKPGTPKPNEYCDL